MSRTQGFTLLEAVLSASIFSVVLYGGVTVANLSVRTTRESMNMRSEALKRERLAEKSHKTLVSASLATLEGIPSGGGMLPEPLLDGVAYTNVSFRKVVSFQSGAPVLDPPPGMPPLSLSFVPDAVAADGTGSLVLFDGGATIELMNDVSNLSFSLSGRQLQIKMEIAGKKGPEPFQMAVFLRT